MTNKDNKKTLEQEAQEFVSKKDTTQIKVETDDFFAGHALSGLLASGKYVRSEEIIEEAFSYSDKMINTRTLKRNNKLYNPQLISGGFFLLIRFVLSYVWNYG